MSLMLYSEAKKLSSDKLKAIYIKMGGESVKNNSFKCAGIRVLRDWYFGTVWFFKRDEKGKMYVDPMNTERVAQYHKTGFFQYGIGQGDSIQ